MSTQHLRPTVPHPALVEHAQERAQNLQNRIADRITAYAGSMHFVYLHIALFAVWMIVIEKSPWPTLTLLERRGDLPRTKRVDRCARSCGIASALLRWGGAWLGDIHRALAGADRAWRRVD